MTESDRFYAEVESGVREWVRWLREAGVNTGCSCGHEGWIECQVLDRMNDPEKIKTVLRERRVTHFTIDYQYEEWPDGINIGYWHEGIKVWSKDFKAKLTEGERSEKGGAM